MTAEAWVIPCRTRERPSNDVDEGFRKHKFAGVYSGGATPDPIPNSEVKPASGDGSAAVTLWESSTMPAFFSTR